MGNFRPVIASNLDQRFLILNLGKKPISLCILCLSCLALQACDFEYYGYICGKNYKGQPNEKYVEDEVRCLEPSAEDRRAFNLGGRIVSIRDSSPYDDGKWGYLDYEDKVVIQPQFVSAREFSEGLAAVALDFGDGGKEYSQKWGYIDKNGQVVIPFKFENVRQFREGLAAVAVDFAGKWGYINPKGHYIIPPTFDEVKVFSQGLAAVKVADQDGSISKWGYIDRTGKMVIKPQFDIADSFEQGVARVVAAGKQVYIRKPQPSQTSP